MVPANQITPGPTWRNSSAELGYSVRACSQTSNCSSPASDGTAAAASREPPPAIYPRHQRPYRSEFEPIFRQALAGSDLPPAQFNVRVGDREVDVVWPEAPLVVELDRLAYHGDDRSELDRKPDAHLTALRYAVIRLTRRRWHDQPEIELRIRAVIRSHARTGDGPDGRRVELDAEGRRDRRTPIPTTGLPAWPRLGGRY